MSVGKIGGKEIAVDEQRRFIQESVKTHEIENFDNAILNRLAKKQVNPADHARQAYDRMHHKHNRS